MPKNLDNSFGINHLTGASHVYEKGQEPGALTRHIRNLLQKDARDRIAKSNVAALIDSSGGTAPVQYEQGDSDPLPANVVTGGTTGVTAASLNTAADTAMAAFAVLLERLNDAAFSLLGGGSADEGPGTIATSGTIPAVDDTASSNTNDTDAASTVSALAVQADLLHTQRTVMHAIDDARVMVGLARQIPAGPGRWDGTGDLTFADDNPDTITRASGSWVTDGFMPGDVIDSAGSADNNGSFTIASMTATVITLVTADVLVAEVITAATEGPTYTLLTNSRRTFPGRLEGADTLDIDGAPSAGGSVWTLSFETGTSAISNAANVDPPAAAVLLTEWDAFVDQLSDNIALMATLVDAVTSAVTNPGVVSTQIPFFIDQTQFADGSDVVITSPVSGRIRGMRTVVMDEVVTGEAAITAEIGGTPVTNLLVTVATAAVLGTFDLDSAVADTAANLVLAGEEIAIQTDATPSAGAVFGWLEVVETGEGDDNLAGYAG